MAIAILSALVILNLFATIAVARNGAYPARRKAVQFSVIWLVPAFGALACIVFARADATPMAPDKPQEFYENADSSGADH